MYREDVNSILSRMFEEIADALEFLGENAFKVSAYRRASRVIADLPEDVRVLLEQGKLRKVKGIGEGIEKKIKEFIETGKMSKYEEVISKVPRKLLKLMEIPGLGPKTLSLLYKNFKVDGLTKLKSVLKEEKVLSLPGMGEKKIEKILKGIEMYERREARMFIHDADALATDIIDFLSQEKPKRITFAGSLRRRKETIGDIDILVVTDKSTNIMKRFTSYGNVMEILASGETKSSVIVNWKNMERQVDLRVVPEESYGAALQYFTGSKEHNIRLRSIAKDKGFKINEYGVFQGDKFMCGKEEEEVYDILGLLWIPPELREDRGEIERAMERSLPDLVEMRDIKGDLHIHTTYSDGNMSPEEMVSFAIKKGYEYIAITEHSVSVKYARGLDKEGLKRLWDEIDRLNEKYGEKIKVLKGTEVDILKDGSLDYPEEILEKFDIVIAAIHQSFNYRTTERMIKAIENPLVHIIAHPTGRLISRRKGYEDYDIDEVIEAAAENSKILELNAYPERLDLDELNLRKAKNKGIKIAINTDAHGITDMEYMKYGVGIARRGWLEKQDVINTLHFHDLMKILKGGKE